MSTLQCRRCGRSGHRDSRSSECPLRVSRPLTCGACGETGHSRRSAQCRLNEARPIRAAINYQADSIGIRRHMLGRMFVRCPFWSGMMWEEERTQGSTSQPSFLMCCSHGKVRLPPIRPLPNILAELTMNHTDSPAFFKNIRALTHRVRMQNIRA